MSSLRNSGDIDVQEQILLKHLAGMGHSLDRSEIAMSTFSDRFRPILQTALEDLDRLADQDPTD